MGQWTFIRHGQSLANAEGWFAGQRDSPLTELGQQQALDAHQQVAGHSFDRALCSDLQRAHDTAKVVLRGRDVPLQVTASLRERTCGAWEGRPIAQLEASGAIEEFRSWEARPGDGESLKDVALRVYTLLASLPETASTLVVSHGALMRAVIGRLDARPLDEIGAWQPTNCEVVRRDVSAARWAELAAALAPTS